MKSHILIKDSNYLPLVLDKIFKSHIDLFKIFSFPRVFAKSVSIGVIKRIAALNINENVNRQFCVRYMSVLTTKFVSLPYQSSTASPNHVSVVCTRRKWRPCQMELINGKYFIAVIIPWAFLMPN